VVPSAPDAVLLLRSYHLRYHATYRLHFPVVIVHAFCYATAVACSVSTVTFVAVYTYRSVDRSTRYRLRPFTVTRVLLPDFRRHYLCWVPYLTFTLHFVAYLPRCYLRAPVVFYTVSGYRHPLHHLLRALPFPLRCRYVPRFTLLNVVRYRLVLATVTHFVPRSFVTFTLQFAYRLHVGLPLYGLPLAGLRTFVYRSFYAVYCLRSTPCVTLPVTYCVAIYCRCTITLRVITDAFLVRFHAFVTYAAPTWCLFTFHCCR